MLKSLRNSKLNIKKITLVILIISLFLTGCGIGPISNLSILTDLAAKQSNENIADENPSGISVYGTDGLEITASESVINMMEDEDNKEFKSASSLLKDRQDIITYEDDYYAYSMLGESGKNTYNEILAVLLSMEDDIELTTTDRELIDQCFRCVMVDHPEIFYVTGYSISKFLLGDEIKKITFKGTYTMDKAAADSKRKLVDEYVKKCIEGIDSAWDDYDKIKYVYEYLIKNNEYNLDAPNNQNILSVVENGETVCQGYAKMTQLLLNEIGIFATLVNGQALSGAASDDGIIYDNSSYSSKFDLDNDGWGAHVWNIVKSNGNYYNVDTTWGDASFLYTDDAAGSYVEGPDINYDYLLVPDTALFNNHSATPVVKMPSCSSMDDNYYVREGLYFTSVDGDKLQSTFNRAYADGKTYLTIKCSDSSVYDKMKDYFFDKEKIFDYLSGTSVRYVEYQERCALMIYL